MLAEHTREGQNETIGGWPLLTVETEVNGDSQSTNERGPSLVVSLGFPCRYKTFFPALAALVGPGTKCFPHLPASWAGSRAGSPVS
jgi:hypothetical protein